MAYVSVGDVRSYLSGGNVILPTVDDTLLTDFATRAQSIIEKFCMRKFESRTETRYFDAQKYDVYRGRVLEMDDDLLSVTTLTNGDASVISSANYDLLPYNDNPKYAIRLKESSTVVWLPTGAGDFERAISVTGTWGYSATPPDAIKLATLRLTHWLYRQKDTAADIDRPLLTTSGAVVMPASLPKDVESTLRMYRRELLGVA